jgi:sigma-B regulation protein RsbQ
LIAYEEGDTLDIISRNNVHIYGDGPTLLYAHGFGCNQEMWAQITPAFAHTHRQVLFDYVGSGKSDIKAFDIKRYSNLQGYARDILEVCEALDLRQGITLVSHSVGSSIALLASIERPELFERLIMVGPTPCFLNHPPDYFGGFEREDLEGLLSLMDQNYIGWANYLAPIVSGEAGGNARAGLISGELSESFCSTDPVVARIFAEATFFSDNRKDLALVSCPSLILQHKNDALVPIGVGEYLHAQLAGSTLKVLDVAGHCGHMSHPQLVITAMQDYLNLAPTRS